MGDINHSREFPPRVVDEGFKVLTAQLAEYFTDTKYNFPLPFTVIVDKDQSHLR